MHDQRKVCSGDSGVRDALGEDVGAAMADVEVHSTAPCFYAPWAETGRTAVRIKGALAGRHSRLMHREAIREP
jgi:hypothetical protein